MKCTLTLVVIGALAAATLGQGIANSAHDARLWGLGINQICIPCHAPHNAQNAATAALWNHALTTQTFAMYGSTLSGTTTDPTPNTASKLCLGCHDGVTNIDAYGGYAGSVNMQNYGPGYNIGTNLQNDHPISILYDYNVTSTGTHDLKDPTQFTPGNFNNVPWLFSNKVECSSCHDVHNSYPNSDLLRVTKTGSAICLACHDK